MKIVKIVSCSKHSNISSTSLGKSLYYIDQLPKNIPITYKIHNNNKQSLPKVYNQYLNQDHQHCIVVFVHDDVYINNLIDLPDQLNKAIKQFDIVGLAGRKDCKLQRPALWHLMGNNNQMSGAVAHGNNQNQMFMTNFGVTPSRCILLDGLFLAVNIEKALQVNLKFDETNPCISHFYDLDFCLSANKKKLKMGTWPLWCNHLSPGLSSINNSEWQRGQEWFLNKWLNK